MHSAHLSVPCDETTTTWTWATAMASTLSLSPTKFSTTLALQIKDNENARASSCVFCKGVESRGRLLNVLSFPSETRVFKKKNGWKKNRRDWLRSLGKIIIGIIQQYVPLEPTTWSFSSSTGESSSKVSSISALVFFPSSTAMTVYTQNHIDTSGEEKRRHSFCVCGIHGKIVLRFGSPIWRFNLPATRSLCGCRARAASQLAPSVTLLHAWALV